MNASSPMRDRRFRQFICDRALAGCRPASARVYDIGGTGQVFPAMDAQARIAQALDVNPISPGPNGLEDISQIASGSADLLIMCRIFPYLDDSEAQRLLSAAAAALSRAGCLVVCEPDCGSLRRFIYQSIGRALGRHFIYRTAAEATEILRRAGFASPELHRYTRFGFGRSFILFTHRP